MKTSLLFFVAFALFVSVAWKNKEPLLEGRRFIIEINEQATAKVFQDELTFSGDKMSSKSMSIEYNFQPGPYATTTLTFAALNKNAKGETLLWRGSIIGNKIEGTAQLSKEGSTMKVFSFTGTPR